jgi:hypothetical protein
MGTSVKIVSPFGMAIVNRALRLARSLPQPEVRPWFDPHPEKRLRERFDSLLTSEEEKRSEALMSKEEDLFATPPAALESLRATLARVTPEDYTGNAYWQLTVLGLLPRGGTWGLIQGVADCTPHDKVSNRTRWALQMLLIRYWMKYGQPPTTDSFLYVWHDTAFQFAGQSRTIGKLAWALMRATPKVFDQETAREVGCTAIYYTNQPDGTIPILGVIPRMVIDRESKLFFYDE